MTEKVVRLDVCEDIRQGRDPFTRILQAAASLHNGQVLLLIAPFDPVPLYRMMARQGFLYKSRPTQNGEWEVLFSRNAASEPLDSGVSRTPEEIRGCQAIETLELDALGLEPPQAMAAILEALTTLPEGAQLRARTAGPPNQLDAPLQERGCIGKTERHDDGSFVTLIRRK